MVTNVCAKLNYDRFHITNSLRQFSKIWQQAQEEEEEEEEEHSYFVVGTRFGFKIANICTVPSRLAVWRWLSFNGLL